MATSALPGFIAILNQVTTEVQSSFAGLSPAQLNWKPSPEQWSVAQCLDHLLSTNRPYFAKLKEVTDPARKQTLWQNMPVLPGLFGRLLANAVSPNAKRKIKAPGKFQPSSSAIEPRVVEDFVECQAQLITLMNGTANLDLEGIVISSPVTEVMTYRLIDAYTIITNHEQRHLLQAKRIVDTAGFPTR